MKFIALNDLYGSLDVLHHAVSKGLAGVYAVHQQALDPFQIRLASVDGLQSSVTIRDISRGHVDGVRQTLRVDCDVTLDAGDLLARVVALFFCRVSVLHALRVNNDEAGRGVAPQFGAGLAN